MNPNLVRVIDLGYTDLFWTARRSRLHLVALRVKPPAPGAGQKMRARLPKIDALETLTAMVARAERDNRSDE